MSVNLGPRPGFSLFNLHVHGHLHQDGKDKDDEEEEEEEQEEGVEDAGAGDREEEEDEDLAPELVVELPEEAAGVGVALWLVAGVLGAASARWLRQRARRRREKAERQRQKFARARQVTADADATKALAAAARQGADAAAPSAGATSEATAATAAVAAPVPAVGSASAQATTADIWSRPVVMGGGAAAPFDARSEVSVAATEPPNTPAFDAESVTTEVGSVAETEPPPPHETLSESLDGPISAPLPKVQQQQQQQQQQQPAPPEAPLLTPGKVLRRTASDGARPQQAAGAAAQAQGLSLKAALASDNGGARVEADESPAGASRKKGPVWVGDECYEDAEALQRELVRAAEAKAAAEAAADVAEAARAMAERVRAEATRQAEAAEQKVAEAAKEASEAAEKASERTAAATAAAARVSRLERARDDEPVPDYFG